MDRLEHRQPPGAAGEAADAGDRRARAAGLARGRLGQRSGQRRSDRGLQRAQPRLPDPLPLRTGAAVLPVRRSEEHTSELQSLMRISYAVFCLKKKKHKTNTNDTT